MRPNYKNINQQKQQKVVMQQRKMPSMQDFRKLFTKLDILALILIFIVHLFTGLDKNIKIFVDSFGVSLILMPKFITFMRVLQKNGQPIRLDGPQSHILNKKNTPTMGGLFIIIIGLIITAFYCSASLIYVPILSLVFYGILGFYDDYRKIIKNNSNGISAKKKFIIQCGIGVFLSFLLYSQNPEITKIYLPIVGGQIDISWFFIPFATFVIVGTSNAFNLTDGLDGLSITQFFVSIAFFIFVALGFTHHNNFVSTYVYDLEMAKFLLIMLGSSLAFYWFNSFPAKIFMGDVGSLAFGALIAVTALMFAMPVILIFSCIILVVETISVIIQIYYFRKSNGKRFFLMAPIHHHFEKQNIHENKITQAMFIIAVIFNVIASQI